MFYIKEVKEDRIKIHNIAVFVKKQSLNQTNCLNIIKSFKYNKDVNNLKQHNKEKHKIYQCEDCEPKYNKA